jgi:hypothetical protein
MGVAWGEERRCPLDDFGGEPHERKEVKGTARVNVVEEARDVEQEKGPGASCQAARFDVVDNAQGGIHGTVVVLATELMLVDETEVVGVLHDPPGHDLLKKLSKAF